MNLKIDSAVMNDEEKIIFALRSIYEKHGYKLYRMSKFEEYDLYANNRDFLISDNVITFTDKNGRLLALKPDVTLSVVKNTRDTVGAVHKMCYNENVYRAWRDGGFREIMQTGLECIGDIDDFCVGEVLALAAESLDVISHDFIFEISHIGLLYDVVSSLGLSAYDRNAVLKCAERKNVHEIASICEAAGVPEDKTGDICSLVSLFGAPSDVIDEVKRIADGTSAGRGFSELYSAVRFLMASPYSDRIRIDFSVGGDVNYYNGIVFKGFISGSPGCVLSGGRYDGLLRKLGRGGGAVGFAVYLNTLENLTRGGEKSKDVDTLLIYGDGDDPVLVAAEAARLSADGSSVCASRFADENRKQCRIVRFGVGEAGTV